MKEDEKWLVLDLGSAKCGYVVYDSLLGIVEHGIIYRRSKEVIHRVGEKRYMVNTSDVGGYVKALVDRHGIKRIIVGKGKSVDFLCNSCAIMDVVDESYSTEEAVKMYWLENRPRGIRDIILKMFNLVPEDYDDYAAMIMLERYLRLKEG